MEKRAFKDVEFVRAEQVPKVVMRKKNLHIFSLIFLTIVSFSSLGIGLSNASFGADIRLITSYWTPNLRGLGKLKYVQGEDEQEVFSYICDFAMPFKNVFAEENEDGSFSVFGLGSVVVKACMQGRVDKIDINGEKRTITLSHGSGLSTIYEGLDLLGVKVGDRVEKNTPIGISSSSAIVFKVLYKNKLIAGLTISDGEFSFL